jgi:hypothetical protein
MFRSLTLCLLVLLVVLASAAESKSEHVSSDGKVALKTSEELTSTYNPHAILSLQTPDKIVVLLTAQKQRLPLTQLYDGLPASFQDGAQCVGRVLLSLDGEEAATFLVEGMFPPEGESTHHTVYIVANHEEMEYTLMIHYPIDMGDEGFEWAVALLDDFSWR